MLSPSQSAPSPTAVLSDPTLPNACSLRERDDRLRAMKGLVAHLAHSFNNSLAPLAGYVNLFSEEMKKGDTGEQYLGKFEGAIRKAEGLISAIVQATHPERQYMPRRVDFSSVVQRATELWMKSLPLSPTISVALHAAPVMVLVDEAQWMKALHQLLRNAQLAMVTGGNLTISLQQQELTPEQAAELGFAETRLCCLTMEDTGCGMDEEVLMRACEPLFSTRPNGPSSGLGLTLVHSVVQLHGGQLSLQSVDEVGTTVRIWLPIN